MTDPVARISWLPATSWERRMQPFHDFFTLFLSLDHSFPFPLIFHTFAISDISGHDRILQNVILKTEVGDALSAQSKFVIFWIPWRVYPLFQVESDSQEVYSFDCRKRRGSLIAEQAFYSLILHSFFSVAAHLWKEFSIFHCLEIGLPT